MGRNPFSVDGWDDEPDLLDGRWLERIQVYTNTATNHSSLSLIFPEPKQVISDMFPRLHCLSKTHTPLPVFRSSPNPPVCVGSIYLENKLLLISINFTPKTSHSCLKKWYFPRFSRYLRRRRFVSKVAVLSTARRA